ncbi:MAG TPA: ABC transporter permease [Candidatus Dormibacteraeota bacterium]|nr:ABC transporter permease [Candidatus Dormibacteraeota bacterium]
MSFIGQVLQWFLDGSHWQGDFGIPNRLFEHVYMSAASLAVAALIALPIGITIGHIGRWGNLAINVSNVGRAVPSFALLVFAVQLVGIGFWPAFVALVALGIPPMVTNSYIGMREVDADVREAAKGMGMRDRAVLWQVELPIAAPLIMAGVRTSAVNIVATATLAALVAWGGLGRFIVDGLAQRDTVQLFAGALLVALLSIAVEVSLTGLQRITTPIGLRSETTTQEVRSTSLSAA